jgi:MFS family permease
MTIRKDAEVIGLIGLAHSSSHFYQLILAPLFPWLKLEFGFSYAELGFLMTIFFVISTLTQAAAGFWVDHSGPLKVLLFGLVSLCVSAIILSVSNGYLVLLLGSALAGLGNGVFHPSDYTLINRRVSPVRIPHAYSMHGISGALGWAAAPAFLVSLTTLFGWRSALLGAASMVALIIGLLLVRRRILLGSVEDQAQEKLNKKQQSAFSISFLKLPAVWLCWGFFFLTALSLGGVQSFASAALRMLYDLPVALSTTAYSTYMLASAGGMFVGGFIAAKAKFPERVIMWAFIAAGGLSVLISFVLVSGATVLILFTLMGFGVGMAGPSRDLMIRQATPKEASGRVFGIVYSGLDLGLALGPILFGMLMDWHQESLVFVMIAVFLWASLLTANRVVSNKQVT